MFGSKNELQSEKLSILINTAYKTQWSPEEINWDQSVEVPKGITNKDYIDMVSQLYYAEQATIHIIGKLLYVVPDFQARQYLCTQSMEEARHAQVYSMYLEKLGGIAPINEKLKMVLEDGINWHGSFCGSIVALNVVMEGEALNQQNKRIDTLPCMLFKDINKAIIRDEARHASFGRIYMKERLKEVSLEERQAIYEWVSKLWKLWAVANEGRYVLEGSEILQTSNAEIDERWAHQYKVFQDIGLV